MMTSLIDTLVPSSTYNSLPHIQDVSDAPKTHIQDLEDLRALLVKHKVPRDISIRLIHKHFDVHNDEVMVFNHVKLPAYGTVQIMKPIKSPNNLHGVHYFVNDEGLLQAYEYGNHDLPVIEGLELFLGEFCQMVMERGVQRKFGLKIKQSNELDRGQWTEFEIHEKRSTVMLQHGMPMPDGDSDFTVSTEWFGVTTDDDGRDCSHKTVCKHGKTTCRHCKHCKDHDSIDNCAADNDSFEGLFLGGQRVFQGTPIHDMVSQILVAC